MSSIWVAKRQENICYELTFKPMNNFELNLDACIHNTINEFGFWFKLSSQAGFIKQNTEG